MRIPWIVGVSGASGTPYARAVIGALLDAGEPVDLVISRAARLTLLDETGATVRDAHWKDDVAAWLGRELGDLVYWPAGNLAAGPSSGSYRARGMLVVPASTAACAGIAIGLSKDLLQRAAEVSLKERRTTVVVPRETPVTRSHLEHRGGVAGQPRLLRGGRASDSGSVGGFRGRQGARRGRSSAYPFQAMDRRIVQFAGP